MCGTQILYLLPSQVPDLQVLTLKFREATIQSFRAFPSYTHFREMLRPSPPVRRFLLRLYRNGGVRPDLPPSPFSSPFCYPFALSFPDPSQLSTT